MQRSWVEVSPESHFPIQNLPLGVGRIDAGSPRLVTRIGDQVLDCESLRELGLLGEAFVRPLVDLTSVNRQEARELRHRLSELLDTENSELNRLPDLSTFVCSVDRVEMQLPCRIPAFVDFYSGIHHASNVGRMFRPDMPPLLPNYRYLPVGYNGRASTVVVSGSQINRPSGQFKRADSDVPVFGPTQELDYELEVGFFLAEGNGAGKPISVNDAESHMQGLVLVNDWSARDFQRWEYQPLGPFLAKSFATSASPWVVSLDALEPFRVAGVQEPPPLPHLAGRRPSNFDIELEVALKTPRMSQPETIARSNVKFLYWSFAQQLAHQTSNGTRVEPGELYGSGTISGPDPGSFGSLLEASWRGSRPVVLSETGEKRTFLEDGDEVIFTGYAQGIGYRIGFGELRGQVRA